MTQKLPTSRPAAVLRTIATGVGFTVVVIVLLLWLAGVFAPKAGSAPVAEAGRTVGDTPLGPVRLVRIPATEPAVGTVRAVHEVAVASKLLAKVVEVNIQAGQRVQAGEVLVRLDDADLQARLRQAEAAVSGKEADQAQARIEFERVDRLYQQNNASKLEWERADTALKTTTADLDRARESRSEAQTLAAYATVASPIDGVVVDKHVDVGDTASPGQVLVTLYDPTRMQLIARVRESLAHRLAVGQDIGVQIETLAKTCSGRISEIVPEAESASRTFSVKVTGPCPPGVYSGMFGRLLIPLADEEVLLIPQPAVRRIGQLDIVEAADPPQPGQAPAQRRLWRRAVRLGRTFGDEVEVLAGLVAGEEVAVPAASAPPTSAPTTCTTQPGGSGF